MAVPERDALSLDQAAKEGALASETLAHGHQSFLNPTGEVGKL